MTQSTARQFIEGVPHVKTPVEVASEQHMADCRTLAGWLESPGGQKSVEIIKSRIDTLRKQWEKNPAGVEVSTQYKLRRGQRGSRVDVLVVRKEAERCGIEELERLLDTFARMTREAGNDSGQAVA